MALKSKLKYLRKSLLFLIISNNYICLCKCTSSCFFLLVLELKVLFGISSFPVLSLAKWHSQTLSTDYERVWALCPVEPCCIHQAHRNVTALFKCSTDLPELPGTCGYASFLLLAGLNFKQMAHPISADIVSHTFAILSLPQACPKAELLNHWVNAGPHTSTSLNQPLCNRNAMIWSCSVHATYPPPRFMFPNDHKLSQTHFWLSHPWNLNSWKRTSPRHHQIYLWGFLCNQS